MGKTENRFWDFMIRHRVKLLVIFATLLSMYARFAFRGFISPDMDIFLIPWYDQIKELGGFKALSTQVGNYQISYQVLISLMTYIPIHKEYAYKGLSILFDYAMAAAAGGVVYEVTQSKTKAAISYAAVALLPVTVLNSAAWGQCDSIYTFFLVVCFLLLLREKHTEAFLCYGFAFAFKLQAVFFLPFLLFYYVWSRKFSAWRFLLIPVPVLLFGLIAMTQGRPLGDVFQIYFDQGGQYQQISLNYPSFWNLMVITLAEEGVDHYTELHVLCLAVTVVALGTEMLLLFRRKHLGKDGLLMAASLMVYTCVLFLPAMHERYAYPALIFVTMVCLLSLRTLPAALGMLVIDMQTYGLYLFKKDTLPWEFLVLLNIACFTYLAWETVKEIKRSGDEVDGIQR